MNPPRKALLLAAGYGTRLRSLTADRPKPLLPLWNRPLVLRLLDQLAGWGVRDVLLNLHHAPGPLVCLLRDTPLPVRVACSFEPAILGTAGAVARAEWFFDDAPFWILNGDIVADVEPDPFLRLYARHHPLAVLWVTPHAGPRTVALSGTEIRSFHVAHPGAPGTVTFCGLQLASPALPSYCRGPAPRSLVAAYRTAQADGRPVLGLDVPGAHWADIGSPEGYLDAHARLLAPGAAPRNPAWRVQDASEARLPLHVLGAGARMALRAGWRADGTTVTPLAPRGSNRVFTRLRARSRSAILLRYDTARTENAAYTRLARFMMRAGIRVPRILADSARLRTTVMEDVGGEDLAAYVAAGSAQRRDAMYARILRQAARLHRIPPAQARRARLPLSPAFSDGVYRWEHRLFADHVLRARLNLPEARVRACMRELDTIAARLAAAPERLIHRDLQSSNILIHRGAPVWIDFQGMRFGPPLYDVASLLFDPYVCLPESVIRSRFRLYRTAFGSGAPGLPALHDAAVQRLVQALGAFGRLAAHPDTCRFARHLSAGRQMLQRALAGVPGCPTLARLMKDAILWPSGLASTGPET
jgi:aminoglycoside/choline kinase family phosphotransferase